MKGLVEKSQRLKNAAFQNNITQFCKEFKDCMTKIKSPDPFVQHLARERLNRLQRGLDDEQKKMI